MVFNNYRQEIQNRLDRKSEHRDLLFCRGYIVTEKKITNLHEYPFYDLWNEYSFDNFYCYVHQQQNIHFFSEGDQSVIIIGHAYNPFDGIYDETEISKELLDAFRNGQEKGYFEKLSELTGIHVIILLEGTKLLICQDACSLTSCSYGMIEESLYITGYPQMLADLFGLKMNPMVQKLIRSKCYNIGNRYLPGNLTPYIELKRLGANTYMQFESRRCRIKRFYPLHPLREYRDAEEKSQAIAEIGRLMHNGIECCTKKWSHCAISLTGGTDSKTTLACANGLYDQFDYYSFYSKPQELVDAEGAEKICKEMHLRHVIYEIPEENKDIPDYEFRNHIIRHNTGYIMNLADNEVRKYLFFHDSDVCDVELKSMASETGRVFLERKYDMKMPEVVNERMCSIFQTRFFGHPGLLKWSDDEYYRFLREIELESPLFNMEHADSFYWEIRLAGWGASVIQSQQVYHTTTVPMNNRKILEMILGFPHEERKTDTVHKNVMAYMNQSVLDAGVEIPNLYFHSYRQVMEKVYYKLRTVFYRPKI